MIQSIRILTDELSIYGVPKYSIGRIVCPLLTDPKMYCVEFYVGHWSDKNHFTCQEILESHLEYVDSTTVNLPPTLQNYQHEL